MNPSLSRRNFLKLSAAATTAAFTLPRFSIAAAGRSPNGKLNVACIGIGNRGWFAVSELLKDPNVNIVALCDVDLVMVETTYRAAEEMKRTSLPNCADLRVVPLFRDYREMFAKMADKIDAVTVSTPDHHHFPAAMLALQHGKHVYVEKPLTHSVAEARALRDAVRKKKVISQMGNQGRATEGIRLMKEWIDAGVAGDVREVIAWSPSFGDRYFRRPDKLPVAAEPPPPSLDWNLWLGPAPERPYNPLYQPERWRGWWDFGNGMLGDWACHTLDAPFWSLDLGSPVAVDVEVSEVNPENTPHWAVVKWHFPARGNKPPVTMSWYEGAEKKPGSPARWEDDPKKPGLPDRGMLMVGEKNTIFAPGGRPDSPRLLGNAVWDDFKKHRPAPTIPRVVGGPMVEWLNAIRGTGPLPGSNFEYAVPLAEVVLLGVVAQHGGKSFKWDGQAGRVVDNPALNKLIEIKARDGWKMHSA